MTGPILISEDYLFAKIGRLVVENELLRAGMRDKPEPPPQEPHEAPRSEPPA